MAKRKTRYVPRYKTMKKQETIEYLFGVGIGLLLLADAVNQFVKFYEENKKLKPR